MSVNKGGGGGSRVQMSKKQKSDHFVYDAPSSYTLDLLRNILPRWRSLTEGLFTVSQEFPDSVKNMLLLKNLQFLPDHYETLTKEGTQENLILTKFHNDWVKIVDFLIKAYL